MRLVVDSPAHQHVESTWPEFDRDPRHVRLGLASDGVSPHSLGGKGRPTSVWPVVIMNYNLPPWLSMKKGFLLLSLIIPGPKKVKNIDTYLALLVDELKTLWDGVWAYDGRKSMEGIPRVFKMKGICMWTMHDYLRYGFVSGLQTQGYKACSTCGPSLEDMAKYSRHLRKIVYLGHTKFLPNGT
ncbi:unnamed protein product [Calypogeia fissa]